VDECKPLVVGINGVGAHMLMVQGADDVPAVKPAPDGLLGQCRKLGRAGTAGEQCKAFIEPQFLSLTCCIA
jgi:beta-phosphoglucomutase-like phosphatase (HAD superfamily)